MKLLVLADLHLEFAPFDPPETDADVVILAGDTDLGTKGITWAKEAFPGKPILYVCGNHELYQNTYPSLLAQMQDEAAGSNVHFLDQDEYEQDGVVFLGATLWSDFNLLNNQVLAMAVAQQRVNDFKQIKVFPDDRMFSPADAIQANRLDRRWLMKELRAASKRNKQKTGEKKKIVVITHHLPSLRSVPARYRADIISAAFASNFDDIVAQSGATLWIHGHTHAACDYFLGDYRVLCNPRGYPHESTGFNPGLVVEI